MSALAALTLTSTALLSGQAAYAAPPPATPDSYAASLGPVVDPDVQAAQARAEQARTNGSWSGSGSPGAKAKAPDRPAGKKATLEDARKKAEAENAQRGNTAGKSSVDPGEVVSSSTGADGTTTLKLYQPAPGVSPDVLADSLRKEGKPNVRVIRQQDSSRQAAAAALRFDSGPDACQYEYANTISCPNSYWRNNGFADPLVRMNDHSGNNWTVNTQVGKWYRDTPNIDMTYLWNSCPFQAGARCVDVYSGNYGLSKKWIGLTTLSYSANRVFAESGNMVQYNDAYNPAGGPGYGAFSRDTVTLHELGHVLGLGHNTYSTDCMYGAANFATGTGGQNVYLMGQVYSVTR